MATRCCWPPDISLGRWWARSIAMKKTRSFLTMLGIIIGVASVVIMVSVMQGKAKKSMEMLAVLDGGGVVDLQVRGDAHDQVAQGQAVVKEKLTRLVVHVGVEPGF